LDNKKLFREELSTKYINYSDGDICTINNKSSIVACGYQSSNKYSICQVDVGPERAENNVIKILNNIKIKYRISLNHKSKL